MPCSIGEIRGWFRETKGIRCTELTDGRGKGYPSARDVLGLHAGSEAGRIAQMLTELLYDTKMTIFQTFDKIADLDTDGKSPAQRRNWWVKTLGRLDRKVANG